MTKHLAPDPEENLGETGEAALTIPALVAAVTLAAADGWPVAALNPEAGNHDVTLDPLELAAALRAGQSSWRRFPYYEQRYAGRGRRFTRSDSAWIVTVGKEPLVSAKRQLRWLGALLAARGMPRWLLELHLGALHAELIEAVPGNHAAYAHLLDVAEMLRRERLRHLDTATSIKLALAFDRLVAPNATPSLPEAGALLVAAVADERAGLEGGVDSLMEWLADPDRFSPTWAAAATETVSAARDVAR